MTLLLETLQLMDTAGKTPADVAFIGSADGEYRMTWEQFIPLAAVSYDSSYGSAEVATDLVIEFSDGSFMERSEYDGSEWWEYHQPAKARPGTGKVPSALIGGRWSTVAGLNKEVSA